MFSFPLVLKKSDSHALAYNMNYELYELNPGDERW